MNHSAQTVVVGLSGGVDSAVTAKLLKDLDYNVLALFMKNWDEDDSEGCSAADDLTYAKAVCDQLEIPLHTVNLSFEYWEQVFTEFLKEYKTGRTPNPDILCNQKIKFHEFLWHAKRLGADKIATGHYAGVAQEKHQYHLLKGVDSTKDQSYFLYLLTQEMLRDTLFPLAKIKKSEVRRIALEQRFSNAKRKDSTGICFIGEKKSFQEFLARYLPEQTGDIVNEKKQIIGQHKGAWFYTLGQRQGLGIGGKSGADESPWYVADKDVENNRLLVVQGLHHPRLMSQALIAEKIHWIADRPAENTQDLSAKIRYRQTEEPCEITFQGKELRVNFKHLQWAVAPGQSVVLYQKERCLGGGIIKQAIA